MNATEKPPPLRLGVAFLVKIGSLGCSFASERLIGQPGVPDLLISMMSHSISGLRDEASIEMYFRTIIECKGKINKPAFTRILNEVMSLQSPFPIDAEPGKHQAYVDAKYWEMREFAPWFYPAARAVDVIQSLTRIQIDQRNIEAIVWEIALQVMTVNYKAKDLFCKLFVDSACGMTMAILATLGQSDPSFLEARLPREIRKAADDYVRARLRLP